MASPSSSSTTTCYQDDKHQLGELCIEDIPLFDGFFCVATWNGNRCSGCSEFANSCGTADGWTSSYLLSCHNVLPKFSSMRLCNHQITYSMASSSQTHHSSSSSGGGYGIFWSVFIFALVVRMLISRAWRRQRAASSYLAVPRGDHPQSGTELTTVGQAAEVLRGDGHFIFFDPKVGDAHIATMTEAVDVGNWQALRDWMASLQSSWTPNERSHYVTAIAERIGKAWSTNLTNDTVFSPLLDEWYAAEPENPDCALVRLETLIVWAWHARTGRRANQVTTEQTERFGARLDQAKKELPKALELASQDPAIYAAAIVIAMGRDPDHERIKGYLLSVQSSKDQFQCIVYVRCLTYFCRKWHGSHETMFNLCRASVRNLPRCHPLWLLVPMSHFEVNLTLDRRTSVQYWHKADVRNEIMNAYDQAMGDFETSWDPSLSRVEMAWNRRMRTWFLFACIHCKLVDRARGQARLLGRHPYRGAPWYDMQLYRRYLQTLGFSVDEVLLTAQATEIV
jgi:hypothetical protein